MSNQQDEADANADKRKCDDDPREDSELTVGGDDFGEIVAHTLIHPVFCAPS